MSSSSDPSPDVKVAWLLCTELTTRITTQPLALRDGDEATALTSVADFFKLARKTIAENPGCHRCAKVVLDTINGEIRSFTADWHRRQTLGRLSSTDERFHFRSELKEVQKTLTQLATTLAVVAGMDLPLTFPGKQVTLSIGQLPFGTRSEPELDGAERHEVRQRRRIHGLPDHDNDAVGLALSGGGIRSATFSLGVVQVLARQGLLKEVDFMSTVSGGGYMGSFISAHGIDTLGATGDHEPEQVRHLRNHSKYLAEGGWRTVSQVAYTLLQGVATSALLLLPPLCLLAILVVLFSVQPFLLQLFHLAIPFAVGVLVLLCIWQTTTFGRAKHEQITQHGGRLLIGVVITSLGLALLDDLVTRVSLMLPTNPLGPWIGLALPILFCVSLVPVWFVDLNAIGLHRHYRDRLARTFLCGREALALSELNTKTPAPYHLINTTLNVPHSLAPALRGRRSDLFLLSKHYCGSALTGWRAMQDLAQPITLATAMTISGAAASPHMGTLTTWRHTLPMSLLGLRLSHWLRWPKQGECLSANDTPGMGWFYRELAGIGLHERQPYLNLSDGGHIENLGVYELLRRRCRYIIAIDGECDPEHHFGGLLTLTRMAAIDLDVTIEPNLDDLRRNEQGWTDAHFVMARIGYPNREGEGLLLYVKSSMTGNESEYLRHYRREHPAFPHESTAQQLFSEVQFEAYRALGEHVGKDLFAPYLVDSKGVPPNIPAWLNMLADKLLPD